MNTLKLAARIRKHAIDMTHLGRSSHVASILSIADILAVTYGSAMKIDPKNPFWEARDRFILSKGHAGAGVYAVLAECGFFDVSELHTHCQNGSKLSGHVSHHGVPGVEFSTGSLGHGLPVATGMAKAALLKNSRNKVFALLSDGECDEGSNWEAALFASHHKLNNLIVIIDYNKIQSLDTVEKTIGLEPFATKWESFGWHVEQINGHSHEALGKCLNRTNTVSDKPLCIIADTIKGKGVSFMENSVLWHYRSPQGDEYTAACRELDQAGFSNA